MRDTLTDCNANSMLLKRFETLTGGEEGGAGCRGVSKARTLGTGTLPLGIFGVCAGSWPDTTVFAFCLSCLFLATWGGVLGSVTSDKIGGGRSGSESNVMTVAAGGMKLGGCRALRVAVVFGNANNFSCFPRFSSWPVFSLFAARSSTASFSLSVSWRTSYGDRIGCAFPIGPFGVPRMVLSDLWRSWVPEVRVFVPHLLANLRARRSKSSAVCHTIALVMRHHREKGRKGKGKAKKAN